MGAGCGIGRLGAIFLWAFIFRLIHLAQARRLGCGSCRDQPDPPRRILADELAAIAVTPTELALEPRVPANRISQLAHGKRAITGDTARGTAIGSGISR